MCLRKYKFSFFGFSQIDDITVEAESLSKAVGKAMPLANAPLNSACATSEEAFDYGLAAVAIEFVK